MRLILALILAAAPVVAMAYCTTSTILSGGRVVTCTTCCTGSHCTTTCF